MKRESSTPPITLTFGVADESARSRNRRSDNQIPARQIGHRTHPWPDSVTGGLPSAVGALGALPVVGGFLLNVITGSSDAPRWVADVSPWAHLAAVPNMPPDWPATAVLVLIAAILSALGVTGHSRRDLST